MYFNGLGKPSNNIFIKYQNHEIFRALAVSAALTVHHTIFRQLFDSQFFLTFNVFYSCHKTPQGLEA